MIQIVTIGLSAFLLFFLQPMISKIILPGFGGGSYIWLTSLIFYQLLLLGGYSFSHFVVMKLRPVRQAIVYTAIIILSLLFIPIRIHLLQADLTPVLHIFVLLLVSIGLPYFLLSTTSPMVQYWIASEKKTRNPYVLYAVSNAGSLAGLLAYPTLIETNLTNSRQTALLSYGYIIYVVLILTCSVLYFAGKYKANPVFFKAPPSANPAHETISWHSRLSWVGQSMIPAAALMVFTHHLSVDIVNFPLLWVIPLSLYLISFVICFLAPGISKPGVVRSVIIIMPVLAMTLALRAEFQVAFIWKIVATCACLFAICMFFHGNLERSKPVPEKLTSFYLYLSLGGCLGSIFAGIIAPMIFKTTFELYIVIILSFYLILLPYFRLRMEKFKTLFKALAAILLVIAYINAEILNHHFAVYKTRSFYGTYLIRDLPNIPGKHIAARILSHGTTVHGGQATDGNHHLIPVCYFHLDTGLGQTLLRLPDLKNIGVVGLGTGIVSLYGKRHQTFDFFEIDPTVVDIASNHFDNLRYSRASIRHFVGDARIEISKLPDDSYDMLILDAFTSGAIPTHLLTIEAMEEYLRVLRKDGVILFHITNRFIDLVPVLNSAAKKEGLYLKHHNSFEDLTTHRFSSHWAIITKNKARFDTVTSGNPEWENPPEKTIAWSDEFSNLWSVIKFTN